MSNNLRLTLGIISGILGAIILFCLIVVIGCAVNGLTFPQQIVQWFGDVENTAETIVEEAETTVRMLI